MGTFILAIATIGLTACDGADHWIVIHDKVKLSDVTPGGISAIQFTSKQTAPQALAYAGGSACLLTLLSIVISPALMTFFLPEGTAISMPYVRAVWLALATIVNVMNPSAFVEGAAESASSTWMY